jgi:hypothetical protein
MSDWKFAQKDHPHPLAQLHYFSTTKKHGSGEIEVKITVKEFAAPLTHDHRFLATADIELNQNALPFRPVGWSDTLLGALSDCLRNQRLQRIEGRDSGKRLD